jgi:DNA mismatch endonuclease (patch repair protein)
MSRVKQKNTSPEMALRRALHALGYRYRLHSRDLPGSPDLVFPARRKVIFVHGCFWHGHGCRWGKLPKSRLEYWQNKIATNQERDRVQLTQIRQAGWESMVVWQCEIKDLAEVSARVLAFLES